MREADPIPNLEAVQNGTFVVVSPTKVAFPATINVAILASHTPVTPITARRSAIWHKYNMANVGVKANILKVSTRLKKSLVSAGVLERYPSEHCLFDEDQQNNGVYLVLKGKVRLSVQDLRRLDRVFSVGSLLGVPATFIGRPYSLAAVAVTDAEVLHVERQAFLDLMTQQPELCREATDMLSREVSFIHAALAERRRQKCVLA